MAHTDDASPSPSPFARCNNHRSFASFFFLRSLRGVYVRERDRLRCSSGEIGLENRDGTHQLRAVRARVHGGGLFRRRLRLHSRTSSHEIGVVQTDGEEQEKTLHTPDRQTGWREEQGAIININLKGNPGVG